MHLGFRGEVDAETLAGWVERQERARLLEALHVLPVASGDWVFVPAGLPQAIGEGVFVVELQEPSDLSVLLEWDGFAVDGTRDGHLGLGFDVALGSVTLARVETDELAALRRSPADGSELRPGARRLLPPQADPYFRAEDLRPDPVVSLGPNFSVLIVLEGHGSLETSTAARSSFAAARRCSSHMPPEPQNSPAPSKRSGVCRLRVEIRMALVDQTEIVDAVADGVQREEESRWQRALPYLARTWLFLFLLGLIAYFWLTTPSHSFFTGSNFKLIALNTSEVVLLAIGETFIIVTAGIDLSIGGILLFAGVCGGKTMLSLSGTHHQVELGLYPHANVAIPAGIAVCIVAGTMWGCVNGMFITFLKLPPFIVTLGTLGITFGLSDLISGGTNFFAPVPPSFTSNVGNGKMLGLFVPIWIALVFLLVAHVVFHHTRFGRYTAAIGSNQEGARRTGIAVSRHIVEVYTLAGFLAGAAAILDLAIYTNISSASHQTDNLNAIGAVVIGGTSLFGGVGTLLGSAVGAFIPTVTQNGLVIKGVQPFWQEVLVGATIILAVYLDQVRRRRASR